jgi:hypothetical protein
MAGKRLTTWLAENRFAGRMLVRVGRRGDDLIAEFANLGQLTTSTRGTDVHFEPLAGVDEATLEKLRATVIDAFVRHAQGKVTLHGGAVSVDSKAVALVGPTGSGKSTLTAALCAEAEIGLVADDTVAIELPEIASAASSVEVVPTQKAAWLLPEARRALGLDSALAGKTAIPFRTGTSGRLELAAVVGLVFDSDVRPPELRRLRGQNAFSTLFNSAIRFVVDDPGAQLREFDQLRVLVERCPVYELRRLRDLRQLKDAARRVRDLLAGTHPSDGTG